MSYYDDSSLVMIPSGYKTSKVYSQKPTDGTGDLTFTRSNDTATRVNSAGLIERVRTNLVPNGLSFFAATGVLYTTVTSDSPISGVSSTRITKNEAAGTLRYGNQNVSASVLTGSISYTISRYFKYDGYNVTTSMEFNNSLQWGGRSWVQNIDIASTGVTLQAPSNCTSKITNVGNGWYRVDVTVVNGASPSGSPVTHLLKVDSTLSTGQGFLTAAPQLETGDIATQYIPTTSAAVSVGPVANVPRLDYLNSSCPRLLLEGQRTNLTAQSENFNGWSFKVNVTTTANYAVSPDGYTNADRLQFTGAGFMYGATGFTQTNGTTYTLSCYAKRNGSGTQSVGFFVNGSGVVNSAWTLTSEWQRFTYTYTASNNSSVGIAGANGADVSVYGFQFEAGAYATSYIPTLGASVTRGADAASKTGISSLIGQTEGTMFLDVVAQVDTVESQDFSISDGTANNRASIRLNNSGLINAIGVFGGSVQFSMGTGAYVTGQRYKIALAYKLNDVVLYVNGVQSATDTSATISGTLSRLGFDVNTTGTQNLKSRVNQTLLFKTRLSNSSLAELTSL